MTVHTIIYEELCKGIVKDASREEDLRILSDLVKAEARGIILGCTEIGMLIGPSDCTVPVFNTTQIHAEAAIEFALATA